MFLIYTNRTMKKIIIYVLVSIIAINGTFNITAGLPGHEWQKSAYFNTRFLVDYPAVTTSLKNDGFQEGFFKSSDNLSLHYLFLPRPHARYNVICCAGWLPGRKEGMATFYPLLPDDANILFFDARGHGMSEGPLFSTIWWYGQNEYKDIIGALHFVHEKNHLPTVILGVCAGAFHAAHALIHLKKTGQLSGLNVRGLIFDSGWSELPKASYTVIKAKINERILKSVCSLTKQSKQKAAQSLLYKIPSWMSTLIAQPLHKIFFWPLFTWYNHKTTLIDKINHINIPLLFIHSKDDNYVAFKDVKHLHDQCPHARKWWIKKPSRHACHHLKHTHPYRAQLHAFIHEMFNFVI